MPGPKKVTDDVIYMRISKEMKARLMTLSGTKNMSKVIRTLIERFLADGKPLEDGRELRK